MKPKAMITPKVLNLTCPQAQAIKLSEVYSTYQCTVCVYFFCSVVSVSVNK